MNRGGNTRGGTRGRGRGGGTSDFKHVALDYDQLSSTSKNFNPTPTALPTPVFAYVPTGPSTPRSYPATPSSSTPQSGYTTPQRSYPSSNRGSRGGGTTTDRGTSGGDRAGRGRGGSNRGFTPRGTGFTPRGSTRGGIGGLGFSPRDGGENGMRGINSPGNGYVRPFLVPVAFVKASMLPPGLGGDSDKEEEEVELPMKDEELQPVGDLEDQIHQGALISVIRDLDLHHIGHHSPSLDPEPAEDVLSEEEEDRLVDEQMQRLLITAVPSSRSTSTSPSASSGIPAKSVSTSRRPVAREASPLVIPPNFVLGLSTPAKVAAATAEAGSDSDSSSEEEEEIVFTPQAIRISTLPPTIPVITPSSSISKAVTTPVKIVEKVLVERMMETIEEPLLITSLSTPLSTRLPAFSQPISSAPLLPISSEVESKEEEEEELESEVPSTPFTFNSTSFSIPPPLLDEEDDSSGSDNGRPIVQAKTKQPKLTPSQKRAAKAAGKKARKAGKQHERSGNLHLINAVHRDFEEDEEDEDDLAQGAKLLSAMGLEDVSMEELILEEEEEGEPRVGDSDLEWGSNGPGGRGQPSGGKIKGTSFSAQGSNRKQRRKAERASQRELERLERMSLGARGEVEVALGGRSSERETENFANGSNPTHSKRTNRSRNEGMDEAAADYARNILESGGGEMEDLSFLLRASLGESQKTIDDLLDEALALEEAEEGEEGEEGNGWETTDESESGKDEMDAKQGLGEEESEEEETSEEEVDSDDELEMDIALGEADAQVDLALAEAEDAFMSSSSDVSYSSSSSAENLAIEQALLLGGKIRFSSMGQAGGGGGGRKGVVEKRRQK